jgi:hypothetical protein
MLLTAALYSGKKPRKHKRNCHTPIFGNRKANKNCLLDPFAKVSVISQCPSRLHHFPRLLGLSSLTLAKASLRWSAELAQRPQTTRSFRSDILALRLNRRTTPSGLSGSQETSACCAQERLRRGCRYFILQKGLR